MAVGETFITEEMRVTAPPLAASLSEKVAMPVMNKSLSVAEIAPCSALFPVTSTLPLNHAVDDVMENTPPSVILLCEITTLPLRSCLKDVFQRYSNFEESVH